MEKLQRLLKRLNLSFLFLILFSFTSLSLLSSEKEGREQQQPSSEEIAKSLHQLVAVMQQQGTDIKTLLHEKVEGSKVEPLFERFPNLYLFIEQMIVSKDAFPKLYSISSRENRTKVFYFAVCVILTFLASFVVKRIQKNKSDGFLSDIIGGIFRFFFFTGLRFGLFYLFFQNELDPSIQIFKSTML